MKHQHLGTFFWLKEKKSKYLIFNIILDGPCTGSPSPKGEPAIIAETNRQSSEETPNPETAPDAPGIQMIDYIFFKVYTEHNLTT